MTIFDQLAAPFPPAEIEWRVGSTNSDKTRGLALAYLTARHVMERLDDVIGPANWQDRYEFHGARTVCYLSLRIDGEWITKADGAGDSDVESEKGSISDALKRAAVKFGIGRYLYHLDSPWVETVPQGRSAKIKDSEYARLEGILAKNAALPPPASAAAPVKALKKPDARAVFDRMVKEIRAISDIDTLTAWAGENSNAVRVLPGTWPDEIRTEWATRRADLQAERPNILGAA